MTRVEMMGIMMLNVWLLLMSGGGARARRQLTAQHGAAVARVPSDHTSHHALVYCQHASDKHLVN
jgi:hypothetical protein